MKIYIHLCLSHGINRHLSDAKDIIHDPDFRQSDKVFSAVTTDLKKEGKGGIDHYPPIEIADLKKLYSYCDCENKSNVFFNFNFNFNQVT
jgi:hypothetical protein